MKKLICMLLAALMIFGLCACGSTSDADEEEKNEETDAAEE